jgi:hypothetical protein
MSGGYKQIFPFKDEEKQNEYKKFYEQAIIISK